MAAAAKILFFITFLLGISVNCYILYMLAMPVKRSVGLLFYEKSLNYKPAGTAAR